ncbi:helix-turn-helix domain-containing protein [Agrobacterium sp. rho-13.3]|uniref:helix-turn-helix domain-containing protein n=1 Tax=Agrobacterium sp. rho-13.3 TaxID=3072980 RepID=UPI002A12BE14|nr:helix-turn-helix domain-containing protein [Agrobacterium sp. rho-13.3]MDX8310040.1 helix-turn-helix domain-containing protein [Agrobacterium sp. rho-13.3]
MAITSVKHLPSSLQDVADTLGIGIALKLIAHFGGTEIKFPKNPADDHVILVALGKEDGKAVCEYLAGDFIYIPHGRPRKSVRSDVLELERQGKTRSEIARVLGISQRWVREVANENPPEEPDLFSNDRN